MTGHLAPLPATIQCKIGEKPIHDPNCGLGEIPTKPSSSDQQVTLEDRVGR